MPGLNGSGGEPRVERRGKDDGLPVEKERRVHFVGKVKMLRGNGSSIAAIWF